MCVIIPLNILYLPPPAPVFSADAAAFGCLASLTIPSFYGDAHFEQPSAIHNQARLDSLPTASSEPFDAVSLHTSASLRGSHPLSTLRPDGFGHCFAVKFSWWQGPTPRSLWQASVGCYLHAVFLAVRISNYRPAVDACELRLSLGKCPLPYS